MWESQVNEQLDSVAAAEGLEEISETPPRDPDTARPSGSRDPPVNTRTAESREEVRRAQAIHPLLVVAVFTARLRKRSEIVAVFTAKCWELLACGFHRQCTRVGFRRYIMQQHSEDTCRQSE